MNPLERGVAFIYRQVNWVNVMRNLNKVSEFYISFLQRLRLFKVEQSARPRMESRSVRKFYATFRVVSFFRGDKPEMRSMRLWARLRT